MRKRNAGIVCGLVGLLLAFIAYCSEPAGAQDAPSPFIPPPPATAPPPSASPVVPPPLVPIPAGSPATPRPLSSKEKLKSQSIEQLAEQLAFLRAEEKETLAVLKEKLREQTQKLQKLGIEPDVAPAVTEIKPDTLLPASTVPPGAELPRLGSTRGPVDLFTGPAKSQPPGPK
jgi:hypothetical protein